MSSPKQEIHPQSSRGDADDHVPRRPLSSDRRSVRILVISMGGHRRTMIEEMFAPYHNNKDIEITFIDGIPSRELRTRTKLFYHCHRAQLIPQKEYEAYQNYINNTNNTNNPDTTTTNNNNNDLNWTKCFDGITIDPNHRRGSLSDRSLPYCVELWRKVKTINRGRSVLACFLVHLMALHKLTTEQYDILLEDNVRCGCRTTTTTTSNDENDLNAAFLQQIHDIRMATSSSSTGTTTATTCHMRYYGWLGSIPNIHWIYNTFIPQYTTTTTTNNNINNNHGRIIVVPCPIPSDIHLEQHSSTNVLEDENNDDDDDQEEEEEEDPSKPQDDQNIHSQVASLSLLPLSSSSKPSKQEQQLLPGGTNLVWGTYAYWISREAYDVILQTLQQDIGAILWKGKRMRYYHVKPIDKVVPRIIRNHFDVNHNTTITTTNSIATAPTATTAAEISNPNTLLRSSCIHIPIRPIFFRAPMLSSNIHTKWDAQFCMSTHYQMQQMSALSFSTTTTPTMIVSSYQDLFLSETERRVVDYAQLHNYQVWLTPNEITASQNNNDNNNETKQMSINEEEEAKLG